MNPKFFGKIQDIFETRQMKKSLEDLTGAAIGTWDAARYVREVGERKVLAMRESAERGEYPVRVKNAILKVVDSFDEALNDYKKALRQYELAWDEALLAAEKTFAVATREDEEEEDDDDDDDGPE